MAIDACKGGTDDQIESLPERTDVSKAYFWDNQKPALLTGLNNVSKYRRRSL
jgi:hypothetical protein